MEENMENHMEATVGGLRGLPTIPITYSHLGFAL